jgi:hypothetical protein
MIFRFFYTDARKLNEVSEQRCIECRAFFWAEEPWKVRCLPCWKRGKAADMAAALKHATSRVAELERRLARHNLDKVRVRQLLQLCHPDKHRGSPLATDVTRWLLGLNR